MGTQTQTQEVRKKLASTEAGKVLLKAREEKPLDLDSIQPESVQESPLMILPTIEERTAVNPKIETLADGFVTRILSPNREKESKRIAIDNIGINVQKAATKKTGLLQDPVKNWANNSSEDSMVGKALTDLQIQVESLDPAKFDFQAGWIARNLGFIPIVGTSLKRYFIQFETSQTVIDAIINSLNKSKGRLKRDNIALAKEQQAMRKLTLDLNEMILISQCIDKKLKEKLALMIDGDEKGFIETELLFPLRQRIMDLQQQLAVNQQGVLATEIIIRNNRELIRGVDRANTVTISALRIAVIVAVALNSQRITLDKINALNKTTNDLIAGTSARLKTQGAEINKQASSTMLDMAVLETAFSDLNDAMNDIFTFRQKALPEMKNNIERLDTLAADAEKTIKKMERGDEVAPDLIIDVEYEEVH